MQAWVLTCIPRPQVTEQSDHTDHGVQPPSTGESTTFSRTEQLPGTTEVQIFPILSLPRIKISSAFYSFIAFYSSSQPSSLPLQSMSWQQCPSGVHVLRGKTHKYNLDTSNNISCLEHVQPSYHCLHSPCNQVSPTLSSWLSWRQIGGQGPRSQDLCWTSSNWQSVPSLSGIRDLTETKHYLCVFMS